MKKRKKKMNKKMKKKISFLLLKKFLVPNIFLAYYDYKEIHIK